MSNKAIKVREAEPLRSLGHVERHALLLLVVLGESVVTSGSAPRARTAVRWDAPLALGVALGIAVASGLWWVYFRWRREPRRR
ncbi:low temperature requirement protein A [Streptomyces sp. KL116D]|uniref:low temperature requirement protein A n=1 Tax=Streptomyces sp. KL116D TaxID=3045152 RepID=UPI0035581FA4